MKPGSLIKFSKDHYTGPGLDYCKDWIGIILEYVVGSINPMVAATPEEQYFHRNKDEIRIAWTINGETVIMDYDELWWNNLDYEPFEVFSGS
jgi:hypothetical protein